MGKERGSRQLRHAAALAALVLALPFVGFCAWDRVEAARIVERLDRIPAEPIDVKDLVPTTDEQKRAARLYADAIRLMPERNDAEMRQAAALVADLAALAPAVRATDARMRDLAALEQPYTRMLDLLDQAAALDARGYLPADKLRFGEEARMARPNAIRIARLALEGDSEGAARALLATLRIRRMYPPSWRHYALPTAHSLQLVLSSGVVSEARLTALQREYEILSDDLDVERRLRLDRAMFLSMFPGDVPRAGSAATTAYRRPAPFEALAYRALRPARRHSMVSALDDYEEALTVAAMPWPAKLDATQALVKEKGGVRMPRRRSMLQQVGAPWGRNVGTRALSDAVSSAADALARAAAAVAALAAARDVNREPPLSEDPFTGKPLRFVRRAGGFAVYSVGVNRRDDGGRTELRPDLLPGRGNSPDIGLSVTRTR